MTEDTAPTGQLPLQLPHDPALGRADFIVGRSNRAAIDVVDRWPKWPERGVFLVGPAGSGKSHLVEVWRAASGATRVDAAALDTQFCEALQPDTATAVEDLHDPALDETILFHLVNTALERNVALLLTSRCPVAALSLSLPDLVSRLRAAHAVALEAPDDLLLRQVLTKLFADRQLVVDPAVISFILVRMERSLEAANVIADHLDRRALAKSRAITRRLAGEVLGDLAPAGIASEP